MACGVLVYHKLVKTIRLAFLDAGPDTGPQEARAHPAVRIPGAAPVVLARIPLDFSRPRPATPRPRVAGLEAGVSAGENHKCGGLTATGLRLMRYEYAEQAHLHRTTADSHTSGSAAAAGEGVL